VKTFIAMGTPMPPLRRGVSCGEVAGQVKEYTVHIEKEHSKIFGKYKKVWNRHTISP
jgi:uncharacterized C2H2 Zn-finger protein